VLVIVLGLLPASTSRSGLARLGVVVDGVLVIEEGTQQVKSLSIFARETRDFKQANELRQQRRAPVRAWLQGSDRS
jgi:hypothetical protein